jgi:hypothetical protein
MVTTITTAVVGVAWRKSAHRRVGDHDFRGQATVKEPIMVVGRMGLSTTAWRRAMA